MTILWTSLQAVEATEGRNKSEWQASGVSIDSRTINKGDLFIALKGDNFDGHDYIKSAAEKGAAAAVVNESFDVADNPPLPLLVVKDTQKALEDLAKYKRKNSRAKIIAVTGSVGKTSVKNMLGYVLKIQGKTHVTTGNLNNHIGLPLTIARMEDDCEYGVFELGMNHAGELSSLTRILRPHIAIITAIEPVHMEFFESTEKIAMAKAEIFEGMEDGGIAIIPFDTEHYKLLAQYACGCGAKKVISFGEKDGADIINDECCSGKKDKIEIDLSNEYNPLIAYRVRIKGWPLSYFLSLPGKHQAINSLAVLAAVDAVGADVKIAAESLADVKAGEGRGQFKEIKIRGKKILLVDDSYNASPASMRAAFNILAGMKGRKIAALGDMLELGTQKIKFHEDLAKEISLCGIDKVYTAGDLMKSLYDKLPLSIKGKHCNKALELLPVLSEVLQTGDILLIKGSHGSNMWKLAGELGKS